MQQLYTAAVGTIVFVADLGQGRKEYVCSALSLSMRLNALPTASVVIGCGKSIRDGNTSSADNSAEDILSHVTHSIGKGTNFINCSIYEAYNNTYNILFKGCIIAASLVYKTGSTTIRAVRLECMNVACHLYCQPFNTYTNRCAADVVNTILNTLEDTDNEANIAKYEMIRMSSLDPLDICVELNDLIDHRDIARKIAFIVDAIAVLTQHAVNTESLTEADLGNILHINDYIKSDYKLNYRKLSVNNQTDLDYNMSLCSRFLSTLESGSVMEAILAAITSTDYMLTLVPTWKDMDFTMLLKPSMAWESGTSYNLFFSDIAEMNSTYAPLAHINDPEVFAVDFTPAIEFDNTVGMSGNPGALIGAYSTVPQVKEWLSLRFSDSSIEYAKRVELTKNLMRYKWREFRAPVWMHNSIIKTTDDLDIQTVNKDKQKDNILNRRTWRKEDNRNKLDPVVRDYNAGYQIADRIAQALYAHMHGASATAQITLLPSMRFGTQGRITLEQHIGELVNILPSENGDKQLAMRGMIEGIQFEYNAGQSASCRYSMTLSRVRPYDANEKAVPCPVYVRAY